MTATKLLSAIAFFLFSTICTAQFTDVINSNRPGASQAAFSVGKTVIQAELGVNAFREDYYNDKDKYYNDYMADGWMSDLSVRYGAFFEQLEFMANFDYQREHYSQVNSFYFRHSGLKKAGIGAKFLVYDPMKNYEKKPNLYSWVANHKFSWRQFIPAVGVYAGINFDFSNDKFVRVRDSLDQALKPEENKSTFKGMILTQNQFGRYALVTNIFIEFPKDQLRLNYVVSLTKGFNDRWSGLLEAQIYDADPLFRVGAAYLVYQNIQVDASIGTNIKNEPSRVVAGAGVSWRFDANYEDVYLRIPKEKKSKDDKKKDKKKEKDKKRLDAIENGEKVKE